MVNSPFPASLRSEAKKAAKILREFTVPSAKTGPDKIIPASLFKHAKGLAILTVMKAGFLLSARGGSGIVVARLPNGSWSAPSAIGIAGLGGGLEIGAEVTDFVIILARTAAVEAFSKGGNLTLGGNFSVAAGPLGRNVEGDIAVRGAAAIYTYSKTRGLFAGISIEGSALIERKDTNRKFYQDDDIRAHDILSGRIEPPEECAPLYEVLERHEQLADQAVIDLAEKSAKKAASHGSTKLKSAMEERKRNSFALTADDSDDDDSSRRHSNRPQSYVKSTVIKTVTKSRASTRQDDKHVPAASTSYKRESVTVHHKQSWGDPSPFSAGAAIASPLFHSNTHFSPPTAKNAESGILTVKALFPYKAAIPADLSFKSGELIEVTTRTASIFDWWEGRIGSRLGLFPANYTNAHNVI